MKQLFSTHYYEKNITILEYGSSPFFSIRDDLFTTSKLIILNLSISLIEYIPTTSKYYITESACKYKWKVGQCNNINSETRSKIMTWILSWVSLRQIIQVFTCSIYLQCNLLIKQLEMSFLASSKSCTRQFYVEKVIRI